MVPLNETFFRGGMAALLAAAIGAQSKSFFVDIV